MKVLIGYDGSPSADAALEELKGAGLPDDTKILVAAVASIWMPTPNFEIYETTTASRRVATTVAQLQHQTERTLKEAEEMADKAAARIKSDFPNWQVGTAVLSGDAASEIIRKATEWQADLLSSAHKTVRQSGDFFLAACRRKSLSKRIVRLESLAVVMRGLTKTPRAESSRALITRRAAIR
jgi:nucleotide-binding universal stress UspA family protein